MSNDFYNTTSNPGPNSPGSSSTIRAEFTAIRAGFDKLPTITANGSKLVAVNAGATALEATSTVGGLAITSSTINSTTVGATTPATGAFTTLSASGGITGALTGDVTSSGASAFAVVTVPTQSAGNNSTLAASTAHVFAERSNAATLTNKTLTSPVINTPTGLVKGDVGLGNVDNTSDASKPISTAAQTALDLKAPLASPALTGTPTAPTASAGTATTQIATTAFVSATAFNAALPSQTGNAGKYVTTDGVNASWGAIAPPVGSTLFLAVNFGGL